MAQNDYNVTFINYGCFNNETRLILNKQLTILCGKNGVGKTTALYSLIPNGHNRYKRPETIWECNNPEVKIFLPEYPKYTTTPLPPYASINLSYSKNNNNTNHSFLHQLDNGTYIQYDHNTLSSGEKNLITLCNFDNYDIICIDEDHISHIYGEHLDKIIKDLYNTGSKIVVTLHTPDIAHRFISVFSKQNTLINRIDNLHSIDSYDLTNIDLNLSDLCKALFNDELLLKWVCEDTDPHNVIYLTVNNKTQIQSELRKLHFPFDMPRRNNDLIIKYTNAYIRNTNIVN